MSQFDFISSDFNQDSHNQSCLILHDSPTSVADSHPSLFKFISFNLHGFNQGILKLADLISQKIDVICLQEMWLTSEDIFYKL